MKMMCLRCGVEIDGADLRLSDKSHPNYGGCPECGEKGVPADLSEAVSVRITWHELRCLCMWAERWASQCSQSEPSMMRVVYGIADRIQAQHMDKKTGLTFRSELAELSAAGIDYKQNVIKE